MPPTSFNFRAAKRPDALISPSVISSRAAQNDFDNIRLRHADIVSGIQNQSLKLQTIQQQKATELQNENTMRSEIEKEKMTANSNDMKTVLDFQAKQAEIDVKRAALTQM